MASDEKEVLLVQGDSLTLPHDSVPYPHTWPGLLQRDLDEFYVVNVGQSEKTTADLSGGLNVHQKRELEYYEPEIVVVQVGIVDCAPRYFRRWEKQLLDLIPVHTVSDGLFFLAKYLRSRSESRSYVDKPTFRSNLESYCSRAEKADVDRIVLVNILQPGTTYTEKNPRIEESITSYNAIIEDVADQFSNAETLRPLADDPTVEKAMIEANTLSDGYHLNREGHRHLFKRLPFV